MDTVAKHDEVNHPVQNNTQGTQESQTASDFIDQQLALEADAREALPYKFDKCTNVLGPLRQTVFACLTCSPPPASAAQVYTPAGVCYACSISCHGEHSLVELFSRRNFVCDCGTKRLPSTSSCILRSDPDTGNRGVHSQEPASNNHYNHNFQNRFCACGEEYDPDTEKGTMFQCLGLGTVETGGCGEDWYHPECLLGLGRDWYKAAQTEQKKEEESEPPSHPVPPGFPNEDDFEHLLCYKCVDSNPWIKQYAGTPGFLKPLYRQRTPTPPAQNDASTQQNTVTVETNSSTDLKRKASDADLDVDTRPASPSKRVKDVKDDLDPSLPSSTSTSTSTSTTTDAPSNPPPPTASASISISISTSTSPNTKPTPSHKHDTLPPTTAAMAARTFSMFLTSSFRDELCHCPQCYPALIPHPQLVEEEDTYEPSLSDDASQDEDANNSHAAPGSGTARSAASLLDRGEAALSTMDRVKAIEGVMVYNHLRDKVKEFLKPYAESGQAVSADDIKAYFEKLRGDETAIKEASGKPLDSAGHGSSSGGGGRGGGDADRDGGAGGNRKEQSGY
ncbi:hypothetical protein H2202_005346 [Exophiala xenobiotica]|nr:hypothetical protein H2202_005346 [Exophiala xenobiotica]KAK5214089.1 hypothetical protein LTR41_000281 [Exophiala xenobiotica]KAK5230740.1 hypothetical protein LTR47_007295 [Exophiala xenobiotica]KAK5254026.1 hypothetical protein LTS06_001513 [Exophiala xenobiotica]KAK5320755.1 hypothetical protein LTR93_006967 [Exophiala xenobiotica]